MFDVHFDEPEAAEAFLAAVRARGMVGEIIFDLFAGDDDLEDAARIVQMEGEPDSVWDLIDRHGGWGVQAERSEDVHIASVTRLPTAPRRFHA